MRPTALFLTFFLLYIGFTTLGSFAQQVHQQVLVLHRHEVYRPLGKDSTGSLEVDTLVMNNGSQLSVFGKKNYTIRVHHAFIGKKCRITGQDGHNNGTNFDIYMRLEHLSQLLILAGGQKSEQGNIHYPNGNGGRVCFYFAPGGLTPQTDRPRQDRYLGIDIKAGEGSLNPASDLYRIQAQIQSGQASGGRPLGGFKQGTIFQASPGIDGEFTLQEKDF